MEAKPKRTLLYKLKDETLTPKRAIIQVQKVLDVYTVQWLHDQNRTSAAQTYKLRRDFQFQSEAGLRVHMSKSIKLEDTARIRNNGFAISVPASNNLNLVENVNDYLNGFQNPSEK